MTFLKAGLYAAGLTLALLPASASTFAQEQKPEQARINFVNLGGIDDWHADGDKGLFIKGRNRQWYHAELMGRCIGLDFATHIGFVSEPDGSFDKFSAIMVDHRECQVVSLVKSDAPPAKAKK